MRTLGIDYGDSRVGVAITDALGITAQGLETITHNGINGYKITASNGNSIFLPATGYYDGTRLKEQGTYGSYWSSSLYEDACEHASVLMIDLDRYGSTFCGTDLNYRSCGYSVRPVTE